jgi:ABC-type sugar transport system substrate-binding protein
MKIRAFAAMAFAVLAVAACGSSSSSSSSSSSTAASSAAPTSGATASFHGTTTLPKGTIGILTSSLASESESHWAATAQKALAAVGWKAVVVDGKGDPSVWSEALQNFVTEHVNGIITMVIDPAPVAQQLMAAKAAGIPVISAGVTVAPSKGLYAANYAPPDQGFAEDIAQYAKAHLPAGSQYVALDLSALYGAHALLVQTNPLLQQEGLKLVGTADISANNPVTDARTDTANLISAHPQAKMVLSCCDFTPPITVATLQQANHPDVLSLARYDNLSSLALIRKGAPVAVAATNADTAILTAIDQILAHTAKHTAIDPNADSGKYQFVMISKANVPPAGQFYFVPQKQIDAFVSEWAAEYKQ